MKPTNVINAEFFCEVYYSTVRLMVCDDHAKVKAHFESLYAPMDEEIDITGGWQGGVWVFTSESNKFYHVWVRDGKDWATIFHECIHLAMRILSDKGIDININNQEPLAYYAEYWARKFMDTIHTKPKDKKKGG